MSDWKWYAKFMAAVVVAGIAIAWLLHDRQQGETGQTIEAKPAKEVGKLPKVPVQLKAPIKVYAGGVKLKQSIDLPAEVAQDDNQHVIASSKIEGDQPHTITTVIDTETGEVRTFDRRDPLPWLAWDDRGGLGIYYGIKRGVQTVRIQAHQGLFSVKSVHIVGLANIDQPTNGVSADYFAGIGAEYRW